MASTQASGFMKREDALVGAGWGMVATIAMTALMAVGLATGVSPLPKPIPAALIARTIGPVARPLLVVLALGAHLIYGAVAGAVFSGTVRRPTVPRGLALGSLLWLVMGAVWLPYLGWGPFGVSRGAGVTATTLVLHLVYGAVLGWLLTRRRS